MAIEHHPLTLGDQARMVALRAMLAVSGRPALVPESRPATDEMMAKIAVPDGISVEPGTIAGIGGWWCRPADADPRSAILYLHGGAYVLGSAWAYRGAVGQIASLARTAAFVPDYALAPERRFPAAFDDARGVYDALVDGAGNGSRYAGIRRAAGWPSRCCWRLPATAGRPSPQPRSRRGSTCRCRARR